MASKIMMPASGQNAAESVLVRWLVEEGAAIERGDALFEIETDKATMNVESYAKGTLLKRCYHDGDTVAAGSIVAYIGKPGEQVGEEPAAPAPKAAAADADDEYAPIYPTAAAEEESAPAAAPEAPAATKAQASPKARKAAKEKQVDLLPLYQKLQRPVKYADVLAAAEAPAPAPAPAPAKAEAAAYQVEIPTGMRKTIARRMKESQAVAAPFHVSIKVDMSAFMQLRSQINGALAESGVKVSVNDLLMKCVSVAAAKVPYVNAYYTDQEIRLNSYVNVGLAVALEGGLIVPVVKNVESRSLSEIAKASAQLVAKAKSGALKQDDITGGTITISNMGMFGVDNFTAIINQPESAILAVSAVKDTVVAVNGEIVIRPIMDITATFDHRLIDGGVGARFMGELKKAIENPILLLL